MSRSVICPWIVGICWILGASVVHGELSDFVPGPLDGTTAVATDPGILEITNAIDTYATDYVEIGTGLLRAGLFVALTAGDAAYDHNRKTCRLVTDGAELETVARAQVGQGFFYTISTRVDDVVEHSVQFVVHTTDNGDFIVVSRYLEEQYQPEPTAAQTMTFQIWSLSPLDLVTLTADVLGRLALAGAVTYESVTESLLPQALIKKGSHFGDVLSLKVDNLSSSASTVHIESTVVASPGVDPQFIALDHHLSPGKQIVEIDIGTISSATVYTVDSQGFRDQIFLGRGFGFFDDQSAGGSTVLTYQDQECLPPGGSQSLPGDSFVLFSGCARIVGTVDKWAGLFLPIGSFKGEIFDLPARSVYGIRFWSRSNQPYRLQVEDVEVIDFDFHGEAFSAGDWVEHEVHLDELSQRGIGEVLPFSGRVDVLSWLVDPPDGQNTPLDLTIAGIVLLRNATVFSDGFESGDVSRWSSAVP